MNKQFIVCLTSKSTKKITPLSTANILDPHNRMSPQLILSYVMLNQQFWQHLSKHLERKRITLVNLD